MMDKDGMQKKVFKLTFLVFVLALLDFILLEPGEEAKVILTLVIILSLGVMAADVIILRLRLKKETKRENDDEKWICALQNRNGE